MRALAFLLAIPACAAEFPQAAISNRELQVKFYLPDPGRGYYRGTRFDYSGAIYSLTYRGHEYFGPWFARHDPKIHDAITGPVEEFTAPIGYEEAPPGGVFLRIGVGALRKPEEPAFRRFFTYDIVDPGVWRIHSRKNSITFTHRVTVGDYGYAYTKTVRLAGSQPELVIEHSLRNTGKKPLESPQYNHNFFTIDRQPAGPAFKLIFPFEPKPAADLKGVMETRGREFTYLRPLKPGESAYTEIGGFGGSASDYDIRVENNERGAGVRITGDRALSKIVFWSISSTVCPEPYVNIRVEPGAETKWSIRYRFYSTAAK
ncbi:MAG: hypothetical protein ACE15B_09535 [Bryobacteraceae bacterium]